MTLEEFNKLVSGTVDIVIVRGLDLPHKIKSMRFTFEAYDPDASEHFRPIRKKELSEPIDDLPTELFLRSTDGHYTRHTLATNNGRELLKAVRSHERRARRKSDWMGDVDLHHTFYEGAHPNKETKDGLPVFHVCWGS